MEYLLIGLCIVAFLTVAAVAFVVFSPVVITVDSRRRHVRVRWLMVLEYLLSLPGGAGESGFYFLRKPVAFKVRKAARKENVAKPHKKRRPVRFLMRCMGNSNIRRELARQTAKLLKLLFRSAEVSRSESEVSLPDPALNGILAGAVAGLPRRMGIRVNFTGENSLFLELRLHPLRILKAFLYFGSGLPYWALFKQWRAFSAVRSR